MVLGRSILAQVKSQLVAPCQVCPSHGKSTPGSFMGANSWREALHTGSAIRATRLGRSPNRALARTPRRQPLANAANVKACQSSPGCSWSGSTSENAVAERFWWHGVMALWNASVAHHFPSVTDNHPVTGRFHSCLAIFFGIAENQQKMVSASSLRNGALSVHFHEYADARILQKAKVVRRSSSWTLAPERAAEKCHTNDPQSCSGGRWFW